jgi:hypothetical protein
MLWLAGRVDPETSGHDFRRYEAELAAIHGESDDDELGCAGGEASPAASAAKRASVDKRKSVEQKAVGAPAPAAAAAVETSCGRLTQAENTNAGELRQGTYGTYVATMYCKTNPCKTQEYYTDFWL